MLTRSGTEASGRLRSRLRDETSALILAAAETVIAEEGLHTARMERIAAQAGVSVGTLYNHFEDRTTLLEALFDDRGSRMAEEMERSIGASPDRPAREQVRALLQVMVDHGREHQRLFGALVKDNHGPSRLRAPTISRAAIAISAAVVVERGIASGEFRKDPHRVFAEALVGLARQALACSVEGRGSPREIEAMAELFVRGVSR
jgi:AcrR family transcriptional regulator